MPIQIFNIIVNEYCHWTLFSKLIKRNFPLVIVRIIAFWYQSQPMCIKWEI